ncbi:hypothetical protein ACFXD5_23655 [Streptomyces sp. NPDC059385]|uniref:hypothetical protein n=1 Tax=Streptomyces sp. NPDC059385 TaxID=3346817 RepID=UPI0036742742
MSDSGGRRYKGMKKILSATALALAVLSLAGTAAHASPSGAGGPIPQPKVGASADSNFGDFSEDDLASFNAAFGGHGG